MKLYEKLKKAKEQDLRILTKEIIYQAIKKEFFDSHESQYLFENMTTGFQELTNASKFELETGIMEEAEENLDIVILSIEMLVIEKNLHETWNDVLFHLRKGVLK